MSNKCTSDMQAALLVNLATTALRLGNALLCFASLSALLWAKFAMGLAAQSAQI